MKSQLQLFSIFCLVVLFIASCKTDPGKFDGSTSEKDPNLFIDKNDSVGAYANHIMDDVEFSKCSSLNDYPLASCEILDYCFRIPDDIRSASRWFLYKGYDTKGGDTFQSCFIIAAQFNGGSARPIYKYYKSKVYCPKICGVATFDPLNLTPELMRIMDDTNNNPVLIKEYDEANKYITDYINKYDDSSEGMVYESLINMVPIDPLLLRRVNGTINNGANPVFFHAILGELISLKYPFVMYDVLDKNGVRDPSLGYFRLTTGGVYIGAAAGQLPR